MGNLEIPGSGNNQESTQIPMVEQVPLPVSVFTTTEKVGMMTEEGLRITTQVKVYVSTPAGMTVFYMPPDMAMKTGRAFVKHGREAELGGLQLPSTFMPDVPEDEGAQGD
jgi:hypothetical protein